MSTARLPLQVSAPACQQAFAPQSFASSSESNSEIDKALAQATESHDAHKLLQVEGAGSSCESAFSFHLFTYCSGGRS